MSLLTEEILKDVELKKLIDQEKVTRLENEFEKNRNICKQILSIVHKRNDFPNFLRLFEYLTQRRNQSRESIISMVKNCLNEVLPTLKNNKDSSDLLQTIIKVTEGKIFVEYEYSQAIRKMTEIHLMNNQVDEAAKLIQDVQIEAFGSLENKYKVDYILFQMQVLLQKGDYIRTLIVSNKIKRPHLDDEGFELLKIRFFQLMIEYFFHEKKYIDVSKSYKTLYDFVKSINEVIKSADERVKSENAGKLIIMALKLAISNVEEKSRLKKCKLPMWNTKDSEPNVSREDLHQGDLGDCWLISSLISIVDKDPNDILKCFPNAGNEIDKDGKILGSSITVRLYRIMVHAHRKLNGRIRAYARPICPVDIKMQSTIYDVGNEAKVAWPKFIEKAVSVYRFEKLAIVDKSLGNFGEKLLDNAERLWTKKGEGHQALKGGYTDGIVMAMILGTTGGGTDYDYEITDKTVTNSFYKYLKENLKNFKNKKATVSFRKIFEVNGKLIITDHAYSLDDVSDKEVTITNPWNSSDEGKANWSGQVTIPFKTFCKYCKRIESSSATKKENLVPILD